MNPNSLVPLSQMLITGHYLENRHYFTERSNGTGDELLIYTVAGAGQFRQGELVHVSQQGEFTLLRAGTAHHYRTDPAAGSWELLWAHFHPRLHWWPWLEWPQPIAGVRVWRPELPQRERAGQAMRDMHQLASGGASHHEDWAMNALERVLLEAAPHTLEVQLDPRVVRAIGYLRSHLGQQVRLADIACHCHLSTSRLVHLFSAQTGQSPLVFLETERLKRAAQLLTLTSRRISSIAQEVGYPDPMYFTRRFTARLGMSPRQYRQQGREG